MDTAIAVRHIQKIDRLVGSLHLLIFQVRSEDRTVIAIPKRIEDTYCVVREVGSNRMSTVLYSLTPLRDSV